MPIRFMRWFRAPESLALQRNEARLALRNSRRSASLSGERLSGERHALFHLVDRAAGAAVLVLDVGRNRPPLALQQPQHFTDRRLAFPPRRIVALVLLALLQV